MESPWRTASMLGAMKPAARHVTRAATLLVCLLVCSLLVAASRQLYPALEGGDTYHQGNRTAATCLVYTA